MRAALIQAPHPRQRRAVALVAQGSVLPQMHVSTGGAAGTRVGHGLKAPWAARFARVAPPGRSGVTVVRGSGGGTRAKHGGVGGTLDVVVHEEVLRNVGVRLPARF